MPLSDDLRMERLRRGMRQEAAAEWFGVGQSHISRWERGVEPFSYDRLDALAGFLDLPMKEIEARWRADMHQSEPTNAEIFSLLQEISDRQARLERRLGETDGPQGGAQAGQPRGQRRTRRR